MDIVLSKSDPEYHHSLIYKIITFGIIAFGITIGCNIVGLTHSLLTGQYLASELVNLPKLVICQSCVGKIF